MKKHVVARISQGKIGSKDSLGKVEILLQLKCGRPGGGGQGFRTLADKGGGGGSKMVKILRTSFMYGPLWFFLI